ncbi:amino acid permease-domain-containing protein [Xylariales sp. AK1849]|nr:amino acid permease-domain-containing protein [Xylariales sp. AK1849]
MSQDPEPHIVRSEARRRRARASQPEEIPLQDRNAATEPQRHTFAARARLQKVPPREYLGYLSTSALTLNRMVGAGIFVVPSTVLGITQSKTMSIILWLIGGIITWAGMTVYLEYGIRWPLTGGELHYIHRVWHWPRDLMTYLYSIMFVVLSGSHANALLFGNGVLTASTPPGTAPEQRLQKLFAVLLLSVVCVFQSFSRLNYIRFSDVFALYKSLVLSFISIIGWLALGGVRSPAAAGTGQYGLANIQNDASKGTLSALAVGVALLDILRAYSGYENVNYVLEEVQRPPKDNNRVYRRGLKITVGLITFWYIMVNVAFFTTCTTEELLGTNDTLSLFFTKVFGPSSSTRVASGVLQCISAVGNVMSSTYTNVRVKQEIGRMGIIPVPEFWASSTRYDTPGPALLLHWIFSVLFVILTPLSDPNGYLVMSTMFNYSRTLIEMALGSALLYAPVLESFMFDGTRWRPQSSRMMGKWLLFPLTVIFILSNLFVFVVSWFPPSYQDSLRLKTPALTNYTGPIASMSIYGAAVLYWIIDLIVLPTIGYSLEVKDPELTGTGDRLEVILTYTRTITGPAEKLLAIFAPVRSLLERLWGSWGYSTHVSRDGA